MGRLVLVFVLVLNLDLSPGILERVHEAPAHGGLAQVHQSTGHDEQGGQQQVVVESLHGHRGDRP